jgi:hypothetical protein
MARMTKISQKSFFLPEQEKQQTWAGYRASWAVRRLHFPASLALRHGHKIVVRADYRRKDW